MQAGSVQGGWPCAFLVLFGSCSATPAKPCRRCAETRPKAALPTGVRQAIKAACTDAAVATAILPGG